MKNGNRLSAQVHAISGESVTFDANHPLAGKDVVIELELVELVAGRGPET